jgi:hypothetical protein
MIVRDIALVWAHPATNPRPSAQPQHSYATLREAVSAAQSSTEQAKHSGLVPWLRAGIGHGSAIFDPAGIEILRGAFSEGVEHGIDIPTTYRAPRREVELASSI